MIREHLVRRAAATVSLSLGCALLAGACAETVDTGGSGAVTATTVNAQDVLGPPNKATGEPVTIGVISASRSDSLLSAQFQKAEQGMEAAVGYANDYRGGVGGRPITLFICQGGETPASSQDCANQMVNRGVAAVVMPFSGQGSAIVPILANAGIPYVTLAGASSEELTTPGAFNQSGGFLAILASWADQARKDGKKKVALLAVEGAAATGAKALGSAAFQKAGVDFDVITAPIGTADLTPQLQAAASGGADAIGMVGDVTFCTAFLQAYETLGLSAQRYLLNTCNDETVLNSYAHQFAGSVGSSFTASNPADPDGQTYAAIIQKYATNDVNPDFTVSGGQSAGVIPLLSFINLMDGYQGEVTPAGVTEQVRKSKDVPLFLGGGAKMTCDGKAITTFPNICSSFIEVGTLNEQGRIVDPRLVDVAPLLNPGG